MIVGALEIQLMAGIARLQRDMDRANQVVGNATTSMARAAQMVKNALVGMGAGISFTALVHQVVTAQREFDKLNATLITATGSTANAAIAFQALQAFAATTPYSVQEATEAFIKMRNLGLDPSERALRSYGNTAAAMGKGLNQMVEAVADAATGEFDRLKEFGIIAKQNGDQVALTFKGMTSNIGNNAKEIQSYLRNIGEADFGGGMELRAATLDGAISNLGDAWQTTMRTISSNGIGEVMLSGVMAVSAALQDLSAILDAVGGAAGKEGNAVKEAAGVHALLRTTFEALAVVGTNLAYVFQTIGKDIGAFAAQAVMLFNGGIKGLTDGSTIKAVQHIGRARVAEAEKERRAVDAKSEAILGAAVKAQAAQEKEAELRKQSGEDVLAGMGIVLTAEQLRQKSLADTLELRNKLNGVDAQTAGNLAKLKAALDAGGISQAEYNRYAAQINKEARENTTVYKNSVKQIDLQTEGLQRLAAARAYDNQQAQLQIEFMSRTGQLDAEDALSKAADADLQVLRDQKAILEAQKKLQGGKIDNLGKVRELQAQIERADKEIDARKLKRDNDQFELDQKLYRLATSNYADLLEAAQDESKLQQDRLRDQRDEIAMLGLTSEQVAQVTSQRLLDRAAMLEQRAALQDLVDWTGRLGDESRKQAASLQGQAQATVLQEMVVEQKQVWDEIERTAHDTFVSIFDSGKSTFDRLKDTLKNGLLDLLYQMTLKKWVMNIGANVTSAMGISGATTAAASAAATGGGSSAAGSMGASAIGTAIGSYFGAGGIAGSLAAGAGWVTGATTLGGSLAAAGSLAATGTLGGIASSIGMVAGALGPIALALGAAVMIWKKLDTSGTYHAGGAASATSAGVTAVSASSLNMERIQANADTQKMVSQLAQGVVGILDSTALAFGKTAGYQAATAFADDTSKDGAWGSLVITKLGQSIVNWQDTRGNGKWSQKTFADGEKGQEQYLAALTSSVRTALDSIGLPDWARTMLNGVASDASLDDLAKVVDQINKTQSALGAMRSQLAGFADMSDSAVSALMAAAGGIDALFSKASAYYDAFYTEAEKNSTVNEQIAKQLAAVNLQMPATKDGFRALVEAQMKLGPQGAESVSVLLGVAAAFAQMHPEAEAVAKSLEAQKSALTEAYNAEADALQATIARMGSFATTLRSVRDSALLGNLSPLSPQEKYAEAKAQYQAVLAAARNGDEGAQSNYQGAFTSFLEASRAVFASSSQYQADFAYAQAATAEAARWAELEADVGRAQLDVLKSQVSGIIEVNKSVLSVRDALMQYQAAMGGNTMPLTAVAPPVNTPIPYSSYGTQNTEALVAEVKALRTELSGLRTDQQRQTGDLIGAQFEAAEESSDKITGSFKSVKTSAYRVDPE